MSCQTIADCLNLNTEKVRKDIALISSSSGVPNKGRDIKSLIDDIETILGYKQIMNAVLVGVGSLGTAFFHYNGFEDFGLKIVAGFDTNQALIGKNKSLPVYDVKELTKEKVKELDAHIGIITVPGYAAQSVADLLVKAEIEGIWNFAPTKLNVPSNVIVSNINLATSLAVLSYQLYLKEKKEK